MGARGLPPVPTTVRWKVNKGETLAAQLADRLRNLKKNEADRTRISVVSPKLCGTKALLDTVLTLG